MGERRQAFRRDPISVTIREKEYTAKPLPWQKASDLGNEIVRQNSETANEMVRMFVADEGLPQLEFKLQQKVSDWGSILVLAYPGSELQEFDEYDVDECAALAMAALEVNHLEYIKHLVDPNSLPPSLAGGKDSLTGEELLGQKIGSTQPSSSEDSPEQLPVTSHAENS